MENTIQLTFYSLLATFSILELCLTWAYKGLIANSPKNGMKAIHLDYWINLYFMTTYKAT